MDPRIARKLYFFLQHLRGEPVRKALEDVTRTEFISFDELTAIQAKRQLDQLKFAVHHVPYYQRAFLPFEERINSAQTWDDVNSIMSELPILERSTVQENHSEFIADNRSPNQTYPDKTSGSSGAPLIFPCDQDAWAYRHALMYRCLANFGIQIGEPYIYIFGLHWNKQARFKIFIRNFILNRARVSAFEITPNHLVAHLKIIKRHKPTHIIGYPSAITDLCVMLRERGMDDLYRLNLKGILLTAEPLRIHQRELIEEVTGSRCINVYGSAEGGINAVECPERSLHIQAETTWVQLRDPGLNTGEAIVTDCMLRAFPMIRYAIGDEMVMKTGNCTCGRPHPMIESIEGRSGEPIVLPNGQKINPNLPSYIFKPLARQMLIRRYRFVHTKDQGLQLFLVVTGNFHQEHLGVIEKETRRAFGEDIRFSIQIVDEIPHLPNAKHRDYINL
jgi:phenylacetate-CoA ligase